MDGEWTIVSSRRRRGRPQAPLRDLGGRTRPRMDSACPPFVGRRTRFPQPNQPAPPLVRFFRPPGPQKRTYASVVQQRNPRFAPQRGGSHFHDSRSHTQPQPPTDPAFGALVRRLHSVIKMVHHLQNVAPKQGKPQPRMIARMVEVLGNMIKPASPTPLTIDMITGNAKNWGYNTLIILEDHYKSGLDVLLADLADKLGPDWRTAFQVATKWARRNLPRITQEVIDHAEALVTSCRLDERESGVVQPVPQSTLPQPTVPTPPQPTVPSTVHHPQSRVATQQTVAVGGVATQPKVTHCTVSTNTDMRTDWSTEPNERGEGGQPGSLDLPRSDETPKQQRAQRRVARDNGCVFLGEDELAVEEENEPPLLRDSRHGRGLGLDLLFGEGADQVVRQDTTPILAPVSSPAIPVQIRPENQIAVQVHRTQTQDNGLTHTPQPPLVRVRRHVKTGRKMVEWGLSVSKKWLILGDSNLSRIPGFSIPDLQIESYPGANFRHAQAIMEKAIIHTQVEKVVLSFGLNCRGQKAKETSIRQMQAALRTAKKQFPYSELWIPVINFSTSLPRKEQLTLGQLNTHIRKYVPYIPQLNEDQFHTEQDNVHWTTETAKSMLLHWAAWLNWQTL